MTSPIAESPSTEAVTLAATDASPVPEGIPSSETEPTEESVLAAYVSDLPMTDASEISEPQFDGPAHWGPLPVPDDQVEEQLPVSSDTENEHISTGGASVDMKIEQNYGQAIGQLFEAVKRHSGAALRKEWVEGELKDYVPIGNEAELLNLLRDNRVMVLHAAQPGSGRWTTALRLLSTIQEPQLTIRRIRRESGGSLEMTGLRGHKNTGWILDLRAPDESISEDADLGHELHQSNDLYADGSYLIVLASTRLWERIGRSAVELARTLEPPDSLKLFNALLDSANIASASTWAEKYRQIVEPLRPAQIIAQSRAFASSYRQFKVKKERSPLPEREEDVKEIEEVVRNATSGWMETLAIWHADSDRTSYDRNYLLLAAVYDGAPIDDVHRKIASLAQALGEKGEGAEPLSGQQGPGLVQLAGQINAELLPDGSLRFPGPGFAEAVVRYFWLDRPHLTNAFMKWAVRLSRDLDRPQESQLAEQLAERMVPWVLHQTQATNSISLLRLVASVWSEKKNLEAPAHDLLVMASLDQKIGSRTRKAIGSWADGKETTAALSRTLARVFATLTPAHNQMLGRLCELAASTMEGVPEAVGEGILNLWDNYEFHGILRKTMASWFDAEREQLRQAAASAFLQLALQRDPEGNLTLLSESQTSDWVMRGWRASLEESRPSPLIHRAFTAWLDDAATSGNSREQIFATLAGAVHDTPKEDLRGLRSLNLGRLGERWVSQSAVLERPERDEIRYELDRHTRLADPERPVAPDEEDLPVV